MSLRKGTEIPTIDVCLVTIVTTGATPTELAISTASKIGVEVLTEKVDAKKLVVKGQLISQKGEVVTITGHKLTLTDNVFTPEVAKVLQGGTITFDAVDTDKVIGYTPPVAGSTDKGEACTVKAYSAQYSASGEIVQYECISYPNCHGSPIALNSEDGVFRAPEYSINSAPNMGEAPYAITYIATLPAVT